MRTPNIEAQKVSMSIRTIILVAISIGGAVAMYFKTVDGINNSIEGTNERLDQTNRLIESQNNLIASGRYTDSLNRVYMQSQIDFLKQQLNKK